jgi:glucose-1-phosphate thymidylyltransferase
MPIDVILPVAGLGTRLRPQTWSRPKPLVTVAGKTLIDHVLDRLSDIEVGTVVFITGYLGDQIRDYIRTNYDFDSKFVEQKQQLGQSHAIIQARGEVDGPAIVLFPDMIFEADLTILEQSDEDGGIFVMQVDDPSRFGVVVEEEGRIVNLVEKPDEPISDRAVMGIYYFREVEQLMTAIERQIDANMQTKGEFFLADAIQVMIDDGAVFKSHQATVWEDAGTNEALLDTNRYLLDRVGNSPEIEGSVIMPPALIHPSAKVVNSVIGPYASIGANAQVTGSIIRDSIVDIGASVTLANLTRSIVGRDAVLKGKLARAIIGDNSDVELSSGEDG